VSQKLGLAWSQGLPNGATETIPLVHNGVMYVVAPGAAALAFDATTGDGLLTQGLVRQVTPEIKTVTGHDASYVFALPGK
jgi:glucose dehydrogenase